MYCIAYGSNLNFEQMSYRCPTAQVIGITTIHDYRLLFRGIPSHSVATIEKHKGGAVPALVWDIQPTDEQALDRYEGWPSFYRKETMSVSVGGKRLEAMIYIMNGNRQLSTPNRSYFNTILQGYISAGFDLACLDEAAFVSRTALASAITNK